eukprot:Platyproteum_vivax@DN12731_c0_g1_i1.p1
MPSQKIQFIVDAFKGQVQRMSTHCYGCRVIQRLLEHCPHDQIHSLLEEAMRHIQVLAQDQYGNYVIQHVLQHGRPAEKASIVEKVKRSLLALSMHKFASNVVEKALTCASEEARRSLIAAALGDSNDTNPPIMQMMGDRFANYVVQTMLTHSTGAQRDLLVFRLRDQIHTLKKFPFGGLGVAGKHIASALERVTQEREKTPSRENTGTGLVNGGANSSRGGTSHSPSFTFATPNQQHFPTSGQKHKQGGGGKKSGVNAEQIPIVPKYSDR